MIGATLAEAELQKACEQAGVSVEHVRSGARYSEATAARRAFAVAMLNHGWTYDQIGEATGVTGSAISRGIRRLSQINSDDASVARKPRTKTFAAMECSSCGGGLEVTDSRPSGESVRRRRTCKSCGERKTTYEISLPEDRAVLVRRSGRGGGVKVTEVSVTERASVSIELVGG